MVAHGGHSESFERKAKAWVLATLLLSQHALAVRTATDVGQVEEARFSEEVANAEVQRLQETDMADASEVLDALYYPGRGMPEKTHLASLAEMWDEQSKWEEEATCESLTAAMLEAIGNAHDAIGALCDKDAGTCELALGEDIITQVVEAQLRVANVAGVADHTKCLPEVLSSSDVQQEQMEVLNFADVVLAGNDGRTKHIADKVSRLRESYHQMLAWQWGTVDLASSVHDRSLLVPWDVENGRCPEPCKKCTLTEGFEFKCDLSWKNRKNTPDMEGLDCKTPKLKWWKPWEFGKVCTVSDWEEVAIQNIHVSAMLTCGNAAVLLGITGKLDQNRRQQLHDTCVGLEQGDYVPEAAKLAYGDHLRTGDLVVSAGHKLAFGLLLTLGLASGLGALRVQSRLFPSPITVEQLLAPFALPDLVVTDEDRSLFNGERMVEKDRMLNRLGRCKDVSHIKLERAFAGAMRLLLGFSCAVRRSTIGNAHPHVAEGKRVSAGLALAEKDSWVIGAVTGLANFAVGIVAVPIQLVLMAIASVYMLGYHTFWGVFGILSLPVQALGGFFAWLLGDNKDKQAPTKIGMLMGPPSLPSEEAKKCWQEEGDR